MSTQEKEIAMNEKRAYRRPRPRLPEEPGSIVKGVILEALTGLDEAEAKLTGEQRWTDTPEKDEFTVQKTAHEILPVRLLESLRTLRLALLACLALALLLWVLGYGAEAALAQPGGGGGAGDAIERTIGNVRDYIGGLMIVLGGLGFVISLGLKAASPINENAQYLAHMGIKSSLLAVLGGQVSDLL